MCFLWATRRNRHGQKWHFGVFVISRELLQSLQCSLSRAAELGLSSALVRVYSPSACRLRAALSVLVPCFSVLSFWNLLEFAGLNYFAKVSTNLDISQNQKGFLDKRIRYILAWIDLTKIDFLLLGKMVANIVARESTMCKSVEKRCMVTTLLPLLVECEQWIVTLPLLWTRNIYYTRQTVGTQSRKRSNIDHPPRVHHLHPLQDLVSNLQYRLQWEPSSTRIEKIFQWWSEKVHHHCVVAVVHPIVVYLYPEGKTRSTKWITHKWTQWKLGEIHKRRTQLTARQVKQYFRLIWNGEYLSIILSPHGYWTIHNIWTSYLMQLVFRNDWVGGTREMCSLDTK